MKRWCKLDTVGTAVDKRAGSSTTVHKSHNEPFMAWLFPAGMQFNALDTHGTKKIVVAA
jgi:hypothetical protein